MNFRHYYKSGDLIKFHDYDSGNDGYYKPRPAMVLGYNKQSNSLYAVKITSKEGHTEDYDYRLLGDEVRVPTGLDYSGNNLYGVIKTNNIVEVERKNVSSTLDVFPYETKEKVLNVYTKFKDREWYKEHLNNYNADHEKIMGRFQENLVAEKLGFFYCFKNSENIYEFIKDNPLSVSKIQLLEGRGNSNLFSLMFERNGNDYEATIATKKPINYLMDSWSEPKRVGQWLREDDKFHVLMNRFDAKLIPDPFPHFHKYESLSDFKIRTLEKVERSDVQRREGVVHER